MKNESRIVRKKWICIYGSYYTAPALAAHTGAEVQVWFEEEDLSRILVYTKQEEFICVA
ncbi:MAG: Mu transposase C-terminal domain-containing protein [Magnetococcales bacterium]|nr:Mu transposase C-terminal domain-containing protein [Magnetococcales bacterium]